MRDAFETETGSAWTEALAFIRSNATRRDVSGEWPAEELEKLAEAGVYRLAVPRASGGAGQSALELYLGYERLAAASLAVSLIVSQRDAAIGQLEASLPSAMAAELIERAGRNQIFLTVGIAQLTISRQGGPAALRARKTNDGWRLDGIIPWATGAARADWLVVGAATDDGRQILAAVETRQAGLRVEPPAPLVALKASWTSQVAFHEVTLTAEQVVKGPAERVLGGRNNSLPLGQAFLAMGLCRGGLDLIAEHRSDAAAAACKRLEEQFEALRSEVIGLSQPWRTAEATEAGPRIRGSCSELALRIVHTAVALYKGSALMIDHPAQRLAREAMFLLVWSCPSPVIECTVDLLSEFR